MEVAVKMFLVNTPYYILGIWALFENYKSPIGLAVSIVFLVVGILGTFRSYERWKKERAERIKIEHDIRRQINADNKTDSMKTSSENVNVKKLEL